MHGSHQVGVADALPVHIDPNVILPEGSKRARTAPTRYVDDNYLDLMLADVPENEHFAAVEDDHLSEDESDDDSEDGDEQDQDTTSDDDDAFIVHDEDGSGSDSDFSDGGDGSEESDDEARPSLLALLDRHTRRESSFRFGSPTQAWSHDSRQGVLLRHHDIIRCVLIQQTKKVLVSMPSVHAIGRS